MIFLDSPMATDITEVFLRHKANKLINPSLVIVNLLFASFSIGSGRIVIVLVYVWLFTVIFTIYSPGSASNP